MHCSIVVGEQNDPRWQAVCWEFRLFAYPLVMIAPFAGAV